jgi:Tol biopolymer transport system component
VTLSPGTKLGPYEITAPLGAGGMGEVFLARDTRLGRDVAIKALPAAFAQDPERLARFEREARLLASLTHPNIAGIHGLEEVGNQRYLVLEFVEGETLAGRLARGPLPVDEALEVCRQIAAGVEAAHESGVVHRDLKPGNVMLTSAGSVKVLDFGLAKGGAAGGSSSGVNLSASPTVNYSPTGAGVILGTAAYMSPEQARGKAVDKRTDIWSFGCVLYECLTGRQVYEGETVSDLVARILEREPDWSALPAQTPARVRELLKRCLRKDARERLRDLGDARLELSEVLAGGGSAEATVVPAPMPARGGRLSWSLVGALAVVLAVALVVLVPRTHPAKGDITRLSVAAPGGGLLTGDPGSFALAPDGQALVFSLEDTSGVKRLWLRRLADLESRPLEGTEGATFPFWSPDSRHVGFFADGKLRRIPAGGGSVQTVCDARTGRGGAWSPRNVIVLAPEPGNPIYQVNASGGIPEVATVFDSTRGEYSHRFPSFLPDGRHFLYSVLPEAQGDLFNTCVASLDDPRGKPLVLGSSTARYVPPGYLVFTRDQALIAQRIDLDGPKVVGEPVLLSDQPFASGTISLSPVTSSSTDGTMVYGQADRRPTELIWLSREGRRLQVVVRHPGLLFDPQISPGGDRLAVTDGAAIARIWVFELAHGTSTVLPSAGGQNSVARWSPDGRGVACLNQTPGANTILRLDAGGGPEQILVPAEPSIYREPVAWSPDGRSLLVSELVPGHQRDLIFHSMDDGTNHPWVGTAAMEEAPVFSHDGRWVAYTSDASGRREVFIEAFPTPRGPHRVSTSGTGVLSGSPVIRWRQDDGEIYFLGPDGSSVLACDVRTAPELTTGVPRMLLQFPVDARGIAPSPEGDRFLLLMPLGPAPAAFTLVQNWTSGLGEGK